MNTEGEPFFRAVACGSAPLKALSLRNCPRQPEAVDSHSPHLKVHWKNFDIFFQIEPNNRQKNPGGVRDTR